MVSDYPNLPTKRMRFRLPFILQVFCPLIPLSRGLETEIHANGKEFSYVSFRTEREEEYVLR